MGGTASTYIQIKYGNLIIKLEGQIIGEIKEYCNNFKDKVVDIITRKNPKITYEKYKKIFEKNDDGLHIMKSKVYTFKFKINVPIYEI